METGQPKYSVQELRKMGPWGTVLRASDTLSRVLSSNRFSTLEPMRAREALP